MMFYFDFDHFSHYQYKHCRRLFDIGEKLCDLIQFMYQKKNKIKKESVEGIVP